MFLDRWRTHTSETKKNLLLRGSKTSDVWVKPSEPRSRVQQVPCSRRGVQSQSNQQPHNCSCASPKSLQQSLLLWGVEHLEKCMERCRAETTKASVYRHGDIVWLQNNNICWVNVPFLNYVCLHNKETPYVYNTAGHLLRKSSSQARWLCLFIFIFYRHPVLIDDDDYYDCDYDYYY